jgi:alpha-mannosidase
MWSQWSNLGWNETILLSAERLVSYFLFGIQYSENKIHQKQTILFLPDCFGFTGFLPQMVKQFEIDSFGFR